MNDNFLLRVNLIFTFLSQSSLQATEFIVDSPVPTPYEQVMMDINASVDHRKSGTGTRLPALETQIGAYPDVQIRTVIPVAVLNAPKEKRSAYHYGDIGIGFKYRFLHETKWCPQAAFYPKFTLPSGVPELGTGNKSWTGTVPFWLQKNWGSWSLTAGGGYLFNPAKHKYNYPFGGALLTKKVTERLTLGNELFAQGPISLNNGSRLIYNFGGHYYFTPNTFILFSTGHSIAGAKTYVAFFGVGLTWGPKNPF
ncbi:MAG: transporter [Proteobacteria bacterium]|nr:transporter [Pseudomonadota bacterium]